MAEQTTELDAMRDALERLQKQAEQQDRERRDALVSELRALDRRLGIGYSCPECHQRITPRVSKRTT